MKFEEALTPHTAPHMLDRIREDFEEGGDALLPWHALRIATTAGVDVPKWVLSYFSDRAKHINEIVKTGGPDESKRIGAALGFGGAGRGKTSAGELARSKSRDWAVALKMEEEIDAGVGKDAAAMIAGKAFKISTATAYDAHQKFGDRARLYLRAKQGAG